jgi:hypothetical protein
LISIHLNDRFHESKGSFRWSYVYIDRMTWWEDQE